MKYVQSPSANHYLIVVEGLYCPGGFCPLVGSPMANWSWVRDQTKSNSKDPYEYTIKGTVCPAWDRAPTWSLALADQSPPTKTTSNCDME